MGSSPLGVLLGVHVLVVDDNEDARDILRSLLTYLGAFVSTADSAAAALNILGQIEADVVVCDVNLGDNDAFWLIEQGRRHQPVSRSLRSRAKTSMNARSKMPGSLPI